MRRNVLAKRTRRQRRRAGAGGAMTVAVALLLAALLALGWQWAGIYRRSAALLRTFSDAVAILRDAARDDLEKERLARQYGIALLVGGVRLSALILAVIGAPALALLGMNAAGLVEYRAVVSLMSQWWFILAVGAGAAGLWFIRR